MTDAVVWYQSRAVLAAIATIIMAAMSAFHVLPRDLTQDQIVSFLLVAIPAGIALEGRISATKKIAATPARAAAASIPISPAIAPSELTPDVPAAEQENDNVKILAPLAAAAMLAGCATTGTTGSAVDTAMLTTTKALTVAENAYQLAAAAAIDASKTGKLTPELAAKIKVANDKVIALLNTARAAQSASEQAADATDALSAIGALSALIPSTGQ